MSDLVTLADPTSPVLLPQLPEGTGRLYSFYIRESFYPLRTEYNDYCRWAAAKLRSIRFSQTRHRRLRTTTPTGCTRSAPAGERHLPRPAPRPRHRHPAAHPGGLRGPRRRLPPQLPLPGAEGRAAGQEVASPLVGSGQSAAEIYYDLLSEIDVHGYQLNWVTRSPRFFPLEYTKLTLEMTSPDYVDYFHALPEDDPLPAGGRPEGPVQGHRRRADRRHLRPALPEEPAGPGPHPAAHQHLAGAAPRYDESTGDVHARAAPGGAGQGLRASTPRA